MFKVIPNGPNRVDIEISGKLDGDEMDKGLRELLDQAASIDDGRMLYRITDFDFPAFSAFRVEFSFLPRLFKLIKKFDRVAVIADKEWLRKIGEAEGALIPGLKIKSFEMDDEDDAEEWLAS